MEEINQNNKRTLEISENGDNNINQQKDDDSKNETTENKLETNNNNKYESKKDRSKRMKLENRRKTNKAKKDAKNKQKEDEGNITKELLAETTYSIEDGLRKVVPYYFTFKVWAKERWYGRELIEMFTNEFSQLPEQVYRQKIKTGWIRVNEKIVDATYKLTNKDVIEHRVHRHEPPVSGAKINVVAVDDDVVVVDKPSSIPIHPCGRFRHNTLIFILAAELGYNRLYGVHRLDRLTSGLLILARSPAAAKAKSEAIMNGNVSKRYVALVNGKFPDGEVSVDQPLKVQNHRLGLNQVSPDGKPALTIFTRLSYDPVSNTSVVNCLPKTGRTHQIRLHLQWLGHPIANDPLYNENFKLNAGKILTSDGLEGLGGAGDEDDGFGNSTNNNESNIETTATATTINEGEQNNIVSITEDNFDENKPIPCLDCKIDWGDPMTYAFGIYLHAYQYSGEGWSYKTELPEWAKQTNSENNTDNNSKDLTNTITTNNTSQNEETELKIESKEEDSNSTSLDTNKS